MQPCSRPLGVTPSIWVWNPQPTHTNPLAPSRSIDTNCQPGCVVASLHRVGLLLLLCTKAPRLHTHMRQRRHQIYKSNTCTLSCSPTLQMWSAAQVILGTCTSGAHDPALSRHTKHRNANTTLAYVDWTQTHPALPWASHSTPWASHSTPPTRCVMQTGTCWVCCSCCPCNIMHGADWKCPVF